MIDRRIADPQYASHLVFWNGSNIQAQTFQVPAARPFPDGALEFDSPWNSIIALILLGDRQEERGRHRLEPQAVHLLDPARRSHTFQTRTPPASPLRVW